MFLQSTEVGRSSGAINSQDLFFVLTSPFSKLAFSTLQPPDFAPKSVSPEIRFVSSFSMYVGYGNGYTFLSFKSLFFSDSVVL